MAKDKLIFFSEEGAKVKNTCFLELINGRVSLCFVKPSSSTVSSTTIQTDVSTNFFVVLQSQGHPVLDRNFTRTKWISSTFLDIVSSTSASLTDPLLREILSVLDSADTTDLSLQDGKKFIAALQAKLELYLTQILSSIIPQDSSDIYRDQSHFILLLQNWAETVMAGFYATPTHLLMADCVTKKLQPKLKSKFCARSRNSTTRGHATENFFSPNTSSANLDVDLDAVELIEATSAQEIPFVPLVPYLRPSLFPSNPSKNITFTNLYDYCRVAMLKPIGTKRPFDRNPI